MQADHGTLTRFGVDAVVVRDAHDPSFGRGWPGNRQVTTEAYEHAGTRRIRRGRGGSIGTPCLRGRAEIELRAGR